MRLTAGKAIGGLAVLFVLMQVIVPARTNPASDPALAFRAARPAGDPAAAVFDRSCRDCHSHDTTWPWYSRIAPVSWLVAHDVNEGRSELNLSEFGRYPADQQRHKLEEACEAVRSGEMPMWIHTLAHPEAKLQPGDVETICALSGK
jgi:hypothetical protein